MGGKSTEGWMERLKDDGKEKAGETSGERRGDRSGQGDGMVMDPWEVIWGEAVGEEVVEEEMEEGEKSGEQSCTEAPVTYLYPTTQFAYGKEKIKKGETNVCDHPCEGMAFVLLSTSNPIPAPASASGRAGVVESLWTDGCGGEEVVAVDLVPVPGGSEAADKEKRGGTI